VVSATIEQQWFPIPRGARHHFTYYNRVVAALMYCGHLAIEPRDRILKHWTTGHLYAVMQLIEPGGPVAQGEAMRQLLMMPP
tara:strand:+ start:34 stop:279 length:246 start_codon:yes stop_codon:yes gene_type:complete